MTDDYSVSKTNMDLIKQSSALKKIHEHNRDYFSVTLTIPLGNNALKKVHTNQWLFTDLLAEFDLANWTILADDLNSNTNSWEGYVENRWYIEAVDISVDVSGKAEMKLTVNVFASSYSEFAEDYRSLQKAYTDALNNQNKTTSSSSSNKNTSNAVSTNSNSVLNQSNIKKYKIPEIIYKKAEYICKGKKTDKDKAYALYQWMDKNVDWEYYTNHKKSEVQVYSTGKGNCVDNSRLYRMFCLAVGIKCTFMQGKGCCSGGECAGHQWNKVYLGNKTVQVDCGRSMASWGSHWGKCSSSWETSTSW